MRDDWIGRLLSERYEIQALLGQGKATSVFVAHDNSPLDRQVAVKAVRAWYALTADAIETLINEVRRIANLDHPRILRIYDVGTETVRNAQVFYLVMQLARGGTLADRLEAGPLSLNEIEHILNQVCAALDYAHAHGVLHLDLKPGNILFDEQRNVMVVDLGLVKLIQEAVHSSAGAEVTGQEYVSPEQLSGGPTGPFSDVYTLGIILHQMLTGDLPQRTPMGADSALYLSKSLSPDVRSVIAIATHPDPRQRYHTAGELAEAFARAIAQPTSTPSKRGIEVDASGRNLPLPRESEGEAQAPARDSASKRPRLGHMLAKHWKKIASVAGFIVGIMSCAAAVIIAPEARNILYARLRPTTPVPVPVTPTPTATATPTRVPSVTPTTTPSPTATPIPHLTVTVEQLIVYSGPGEMYDVLGQVEKGDRLTILGCSEDEAWWQVEYFGWPGWVPAHSVVADVDPKAISAVAAPALPNNRPPVAREITLASAVVEAWGAISVTCEASDPDDDELIYTWQASDGFIAGKGNAVTYDAPKTTGGQAITVTVRDERGLEAMRSIQVQVVLAQPPSGTFEPVGLFGQIWTEHLEPHRKLGWANQEDRVTDGAQQFFERGTMFWRKDTDDIYVLTKDGKWQVYVDTWEEGMDEGLCPDVTPPQALYVPIRGFGKVWCEQLGASNAEIGWATTHEQAYEARWQAFERGFMCQGLNGLIYVLYEDNSWQSYPPLPNEGSSGGPSPPSQRIEVGDKVRVCTASDRLVVRTRPRRSSSEITLLDTGTPLDVVDGPAYADGWRWWRIRANDGVFGWVAEGGDEIDPYFICPER